MKLSELHYVELLYETRQSIAAKDVNLVYYLQEIERRLAAGEEAVKKVEKLKSMSTVEMMCENESVRQHVTEWETRCFKTEAELSDLHTRYVALCALCGTYKSEVAELEKDSERKADLFVKKCFECDEFERQASAGQRAVDAMEQNILSIVDACFHAFASSFRNDAKEMAEDLIKTIIQQSKEAR